MPFSQQMFVEQLRESLPDSRATHRKAWAQTIVEHQIPFDCLLGLLHGPNKIAQRFTWLVGDLVEMEPSVVRPSVPLLFSLRNEMTFPGMDRSVAKWLLFCGVPIEIEAEAIQQLMEWLESKEIAVGVKHYASLALIQLTEQGLVDSNRLIKILQQEIETGNVPHSKRMTRVLEKIVELT